jgi:hypothetical protein
MYPEQNWSKEAVETEGFGVPYTEPRRRIFQMVPRRLVEGLVREISYRWRLLWKAPSVDRARKIDCEKQYAERQKLAEEYAKGYLEGWHECYAACLEAVEDSVSDKCEIWAAGDLLSVADTSPEMN